MIVITQTRPVGFFSSFNIIVGALKYLKQNEISNFYVDWTNNLYQQQESNLFDTFFYQQKVESFPQITESKDAVQVGNIYESTLKRELFLELNQVLSYYNYFENNKYKECLALCEKRKDSLGVHVRRTDHVEHSELLDISDYFRIIDKKLLEKGYSNLFLTTDDLRIVTVFRERYGSIVYQNENIVRSYNNQAIHFSNHTNKEQLALDVMVDALSLASCEEIVITSSNVAGYTLMVNPTIQYEQIDTHKNHY
jgi:hypothetical protein